MGSGPPMTQVSAQTNLFAPKGQRAGNKRERQEEIKDEEEGERKKGADPRVFVPEEQRTDRYRLDREETEWTINQWSFIKVKEEISC